MNNVFNSNKTFNIYILFRFHHNLNQCYFSNWDTIVYVLIINLILINICVFIFILGKVFVICIIF